MDTIGVFNSAQGAEAIGLRNLKKVFWNLEAPALYEQSLVRGETQLAKGGALLAETGRSYRPLAQGQVRGPRRDHRNRRLVGQ